MLRQSLVCITHFLYVAFYLQHRHRPFCLHIQTLLYITHTTLSSPSSSKASITQLYLFKFADFLIVILQLLTKRPILFRKSFNHLSSTCCDGSMRTVQRYNNSKLHNTIKQHSSFKFMPFRAAATFQYFTGTELLRIQKTITDMCNMCWAEQYTWCGDVPIKVRFQNLQCIKNNFLTRIRIHFLRKVAIKQFNRTHCGKQSAVSDYHTTVLLCDH